ncbi:MAG: BolA family transcriptional regulator [Rhodobacteraceae bacterium]|nr:BolA family transcriptional regulator [Paracoccaceae bacterium]
MADRERIEDILRRRFNPADLEVVDESEKHRGHSGWRPGGGTHFRVRLVSDRFRGLSRLQRHRLVHAALSPEPMNSIHALTLSLEATRR